MLSIGFKMVRSIDLTKRVELANRKTIFDFSLEIKKVLVFRIYIYWLFTKLSKHNMRIYHVALFNKGWWL